jgi:hypothetical protein
MISFYSLVVQKADVPPDTTRVSPSKDDKDHHGNNNATDTDTDAELVVDLLLCGTPEEPHLPSNSNESECQ